MNKVMRKINHELEVKTNSPVFDLLNIKTQYKLNKISYHIDN